MSERGTEPHGADWTVRTLKEFFEAVLDEQRRAMKTAEEEREKSAAIMRDGLLHQIRQGDEALERHISEQVRQIKTIIEMGTAQVNAAFASSEKAIEKAEVATEKRFESVNEFRAQLGDQATRFMPREVAEAKMEDLGHKIDLLSKAVNANAGRQAGVSASVGLMIAAASIIISIVVVLANVVGN